MRDWIERHKGWTALAVAFLAFGVILFVAGKARAADKGGSGKIAAPDVLVPSKSAPWTGPWIGVNLGYAAQTTNMEGDGAKVDPIGPSVFGPLPFSFDTASEGVTAGVSAGYNVQVNRVVFGVFADYDWMNTGKAFEVQTGRNSATIVGDIGIDSMWSLGGRAGFLVTPHVLLYSLAAYTHIDWATAGVDGGPDPKAWTFGGGVEAMADAGWSVKLEYRFTDIGGDTFAVLGSKSVPSDVVTNGAGAADHNLHQVRLGVAYRF